MCLKPKLYLYYVVSCLRYEYLLVSASPLYIIDVKQTLKLDSWHNTDLDYVYYYTFCALLHCIVVLLLLFALMELVLINGLFAIKLKQYLFITIFNDAKRNTWHHIVVLVTLYTI